MNRPSFTPDLLLRAGILTALALAGMTVSPRPASAGPIVSSAPDCDEQILSRPFLSWLDSAKYTPHPGGGFEGSLEGWQLGGGAGVVQGNQPFPVEGEGTGASLAIPAGAEVTTSSVCVGLGHPTIRLFARRTSGRVTSQLAVEVLFEDREGDVHSLPIGAVVGARDWAPSAPLPIVANLLPLLPEDRTAVAFRFTASGGDWQVDDVFVDPWRAR
jgi:hypothetical protein